jgi:GAF domain-containing protein
VQGTGDERVDGRVVVRALVDLTGSLVGDFDVIEVLQGLVDHCVGTLGVEAAGVLLADHEDVLRIVVSSSEEARLLELYQLQSGEGPCVDAYRSADPVSVPELVGADDRWPRFAPAAREVGYQGVLALPMRLRKEAIGGLNLFYTDQHPALTDEHLPLAQAMADVATVAITHGRLARRSQELTQQLQTALDSRVVIEQAKGLVAGRLQVELEHAFELLRSRARSTNRRLVELAHDVTTGTVEPETLPAHS